MIKKTLILFVLLCFVAISLHAKKQNSTSMKSEKDIAFSTHEKSQNKLTSLDVYSSAKGKDRPVMIFVHGGAWIIGNKHRVNLKPAVFVEKGYVFVSINYRLHPHGTWKQQAGDVATAIAWVKQNIHRYGGNAKKINIMGHSAGAHLAALVATDDRYLKAEKMKLNELQSVVLVDGAGYDIPLQVKTTDLGWLKNIFETVFSKDEKEQKSASPYFHVKAKKGIPPFLILHVANRENSRKQSETFGEKLKEANVSTKVIACKNKTHRTINVEIGKADDQPTDDIFKFLGSLDK